MLQRHKSRCDLKVGGKMTSDGADKVGKLQAIAWLIVACGMAFVLVCLGISLIKWW